MSTVAMARLLEEGITAALAGNKPKARQLLSQGVDHDPTNETAWMWLAGVAETPEQTAHALETVLNLNPENERAQQGLRQTRLNAAAAAMKRQEPKKAWQWLSDAARTEPQNEEIWMALAAAGAAINSNAAVRCLERVIEINPANERAKAGLAWYRSMNGEANTVAPASGILPMPQDTMPMGKKSSPTSITPKHKAAPNWVCPICDHAEEQSHQNCPKCGNITTLRPPAAFARHKVPTPAIVGQTIENLASVPEAVATFDTYYRLALALLNQQRFADAMEELKTALKLKPESADLARYIYSLRVYAEAETSRDREIRSRSAGQMIMVVDDSATIRKVVSMTLEKAGYRTLQAADGTEALMLVREHGVPSLFLIDVMMPGMDGYQLCKMLRQSPETARTPVVMLSGKDGFFNKVRGRMAGASQYITKPFETAQLLEAMKTHIGSASNV